MVLLLVNQGVYDVTDSFQEHHILSVSFFLIPHILNRTEPRCERFTVEGLAINCKLRKKMLPYELIFCFGT